MDSSSNMEDSTHWVDYDWYTEDYNYINTASNSSNVGMEDFDYTEDYNNYIDTTASCSLQDALLSLGWFVLENVMSGVLICLGYKAMASLWKCLTKKKKKKEQLQLPQ